MLIVERLNGERYELTVENTGLHYIDFTVDSPSPLTTLETVEGAHGHIDMGTTLEGRSMRASFIVKAVDRYDYPLVRNLIFRVFDSRESFYLIDDREPGKRWLVKCNSAFSIQQLISTVGEFEIEFLSSSPFAETTGTTLDPFGMGLTMPEVSYTHDTNTFKVYNDGEPIDPRYMHLLITYKGASTNLRIRNLTTGDEWRYTGTTNAGDTVRLERVRSTKNGLSIVRNTNLNVITLENGWNDFEITGTSGVFEVSFDFRFYYL